MIKGIIFDMDGVISDTQKIHAKVESEIFSRFGINLSPDEITQKYAGVKVNIFFQEVLEGKEYDLEKLVKEKRQRMKDLALISVDEVKGSINLIKNLYENSFPLAVASASQIDYVQIVLNQLKIKNYFKELIGGDLVKNGKPHPESFLLAAQKIGVAPQNCLVIEDGISGMQAAKTAGMCCIGLVKDKNKEYPTKNLITSLDELTIDYIKKL